MLKNYITVALRALRRNTTYTFVNVVGLALGMTCCALIMILVYHEWSFDRFHENGDSIYRTYFQWETPSGDLQYQAMMTPEFTETFRTEFSGIERATPYVSGNQNLEIGDEVRSYQVAEVHNDFFSMFSFPLLAGNINSVLLSPDEMAISSEVAASVFGVGPSNWESVLGKTISISREENTYDFSVAGVFETIPANSSLTLDIAISFENYERLRLGGNNWGGRVSTYAQLTNPEAAASILEASTPFVEREYGQYIEALWGADQLAEGSDKYGFHLQPLYEVHSDVDVWHPYEAAAHDPTYSYILSGIGLLILLIACINFMTLSVGQSAGRAREVGVRKVLGAHRSQLMKQYFGESTILALIALLVGSVVTVLALPWFGNLAGVELSLSELSPELILVAFASLVLIVGLVAGGYPAIVLAGFQPSRVLKGDVSSPGRNKLTSSLVVLQYTISIGLIVATGIITQQIQFLFNMDLGYDKEAIVSVSAAGISTAEDELVLAQFKERLEPHSEIRFVERAGSPFTRGSDRNTWQDAAGATHSAYNFGVGYDYLNVMGMEMVAGRFFSEDFPSDPTNSIVVNEALVRDQGLENPVGTKLVGWLEFIYEEAPTIIGVVKDFHYQSLHEEVLPAVMNMHPEYYNFMGAILVKIDPTRTAEALALIENTWNEVRPGQPYSYVFTEDDIASQYTAERQWQSVVTYSAILAILIACLGLFGLALLTVSRRTKEVGIRKVMGASAGSITTLLSREFAILVIVASVLASPLAYWGMTKWLGGFAYSITIGPGIFLIAGFVALTIAMGTVSIHAYRAAHINPADTLRWE